MSTVRDICHDADAFRRSYPHWPHPEPETEPGIQPEPADIAGRSLDEMVRDERWQESES
jgi:hypothetical protein